MALRFTRKNSAILAGAAGLALALAACGGSSGGDATASQPAGCEDYAAYGSYPGEEVYIYSSIREAESDDINASFAKFTECTGIKVTHEGSGEFEASLTVKVEGGQAPTSRSSRSLACSRATSLTASSSSRLPTT